jgi:acetyltransferase-like isoleucine patch superfamily enzyme
MLAMALRVRDYVRRRGLISLLRLGSDLAYEKTATLLWTVAFRIKCRLLGIKPGRQLEVFGNCIIRKHPQSRIEIGNGVQFISSSWRSSTANCFNCKLRTFADTSAIIFGDHSGMTGGAIIARSKTIRIGARCMLAPGVTILDSDFHIAWPPDRRHDTWETDIDRDVTLEENVWIGMGCIILKGVTIGENSVIAAGSVVVSDVPSNCLAGGNPARVLRRLDETGNRASGNAS